MRKSGVLLLVLTLLCLLVSCEFGHGDSQPRPEFTNSPMAGVDTEV